MIGVLIRAPIYWRIPAMLIYFGFVYWAFQRFLKSRHYYQLQLSAAGDLILRQGAQTFAANVLPSTTLWGGLMLLHLRLENGVDVRIPVTKDCLDGESYRRLSVGLRWILGRRNDSKQKNVGDLGNF